MTIPIELILFVFLLAVAIVITRLRQLFAAAMLTGIFGLLSASLFTIMDAVDVAFTEAAVGAGFSTVLFLGTLAFTKNEAKRQKPKLLPFLVVFATGAALVYGTFDMPAYGDPNAIVHQRLAPEFITGSKELIGIPNIVTAVLASYRGYDTMGEVIVVLVAGVGVLLLLGGRHQRDPEDQ